MAKARPESDLPRTVDEFDRWNSEQPERWEFIAGVPVMSPFASASRIALRLLPRKPAIIHTMVPSLTGVILDGIPAPFLKRFRLEGSGDRERWTVLIEEGTGALIAVGGDGMANLALQAVVGTGTPFMIR